MSGTCYEHVSWQSVPDKAMRPGGLKISEQALMMCGFPQDGQILDVGCGYGATLRHLANTRGITGFGIDLSLKLLRQGKIEYPPSKLIQAEAEHLPFMDEWFDMVISECALSLQQTDSAIQEYTRVLKENGFILISDLYVRNENGISALKALSPGTCLSTAMTQKRIVNLLAQNGLKVNTWKDCSSELKQFPICTLASAANIDPFDLHLAAAKARLGYYFLIARKIYGYSERNSILNLL